MFKRWKLKRIKAIETMPKAESAATEASAPEKQESQPAKAEPQK